MMNHQEAKQKKTKCLVLWDTNGGFADVNPLYDVVTRYDAQYGISKAWID